MQQPKAPLSRMKVDCDSEWRSRNKKITADSSLSLGVYLLRRRLPYITEKEYRSLKM